ncbi:ParB/RepB/Spo0J family partition protein [Helicobacter sp. 11S03491-1]|uniref:IbrB-like domain-containing protein n=1 Tax=Helicobacter sp. 11S03491-1 TaxID=1476196 RepID=UPI000BA789A0|nr:ParB/RepB/Spo0J family partition protein [Helicobacter sp. 11S03491-1]PAF41445.1 chromosome partitioning protein ParB [Helicobacter sp. 11S03491-1]
MNKKTKETKNDFESPVYGIIRVPVDKIRANSYNPNVIATPEMKILETSILEDGYTMPIVCYYLKDEDKYEIVDGFHRYCILKKNKKIYQREKGCLPVSVIDKPLEERMYSTIRHNRARGEHVIEKMEEIIVALCRAGHADSYIVKKLGMSADELIRLKQLSGLKELFRDRDFSKAWKIRTGEFKHQGS